MKAAPATMTFSELGLKTLGTCFVPAMMSSELRINDNHLGGFKGVTYMGIGCMAVSALFNPSMVRGALFALGGAAAGLGITSALSAAQTIFSNNLEKWNADASRISSPTRSELFWDSADKTIKELNYRKGTPYVLGAAAVLTAYFWTHAAIFGTSSFHTYTRILAPLILLGNVVLDAKDARNIFEYQLKQAITSCKEDMNKVEEEKP